MDKLEQPADAWSEGARVYVRDPRGANVVCWESVFADAEEESVNDGIMRGDVSAWEQLRVAEAKAHRRAASASRMTAGDALAMIGALD